MSASGSGPGIQYKFSQVGVDDLVDRIKQLHNEFRNGQLTYKEYRSEVREATAQGRAATQEFNQMKGAIAAANPGLLEFTRTMSLFGGVANTVLSVTNAINLATLVGNQYDQQVADTQVQLAEVRRKAASDLSTYGPLSQQYQDDLQLEAALTNKLAYEEQQRARQSVQNSVTIIASGFAVAGSVAQTYLGFKALLASISPQTWENIGIAMTALGNSLKTIGTGMLTVLGPIAIAVAAFYGAYELIRALNPKYAESMDELSKIIENNWHVDSLTAQLVAPFVGAYLGFAKIEDQITEQLYNFINGIINLLNSVPDAVNKAFGRVVIPKIGNLTPPGFGNNGQDTFYNQAIKDLNISGGISKSSGSSGIDFTSEQKKTNDIVKSLLGTWQSSTDPTLASIDLGVSDVATNSAIYAQLARQQLDSMRDQKNAQVTIQTAIQEGIKNQTQRIEDLKKQYDDAQKNLNSVSASHQAIMDSSPNLTPSDFSDIMDAVGNVQSIQNQITDAQTNVAQLQSKGQVLDNATSGLAPVLASLGLSADTGIGSIISGALGDAAGPGGAGITADQLAQFAATHDYGIFTQATLGDAFPNGITGGHGNGPTDKEQIDDLAKSLAKNLGVDLASHPYLQQQAHDILLKGKVIKAASGFDGTVSTPTHFLAGEAGPETVSIRPLNKSGGQSSPNITVIVQGSLRSDTDLANVIRKVMKDDIRRVF